MAKSDSEIAFDIWPNGINCLGFWDFYVKNYQMVLYFMKLDSFYPQISLKWNKTQ